MGQSNRLIAKSPFDSFDFTRPLLSREQIKRREEARFANPADREIAHLRALNHLAEQLNRSVDIRTLLATVIETLVRAMGLRAAWAFLWTEAGLYTTTSATDPPHDSPQPHVVVYRPVSNTTTEAVCVSRLIVTASVCYETAD